MYVTANTTNVHPTLDSLAKVRYFILVILIRCEVIISYDLLIWEFIWLSLWYSSKIVVFGFMGRYESL